IRDRHHTEKKDAPSGTAISLAEQILAKIGRKNKWVNEPSNESSNEASNLIIRSERIDPAPGTHSIIYNSPIDSIEIKHTAHTRKGFAGGAVLAAEFVHKKIGIFTMSNVLGL
ncbi:MAG: 4-hydroxy-tetrahydrodipicolinate reductase, partial [Chitinophagia bacterium]|nr:4-hydroxy-tetrahydrodipicolinate reductase [Chitinophagia bacterium]